MLTHSQFWIRENHGVKVGSPDNLHTGLKTGVKQSDYCWLHWEKKSIPQVADKNFRVFTLVASLLLQSLLEWNCQTFLQTLSRHPLTVREVKVMPEGCIQNDSNFNLKANLLHFPIVSHVFHL